MSPSFILCKRTIVLNVFILFFWGGGGLLVSCLFLFCFFNFSLFFFFYTFLFYGHRNGEPKDGGPSVSSCFIFFCIEKTTTHTHRYKVTHTHSHIWEEVKSNVHRRFFFYHFFSCFVNSRDYAECPLFFFKYHPLISLRALGWLLHCCRTFFYLFTSVLLWRWKKKKMFSVSCFSEFELVGFLDIPCSLERTAVNSYP